MSSYQQSSGFDANSRASTPDYQHIMLPPGLLDDLNLTQGINEDSLHEQPRGRSPAIEDPDNFAQSVALLAFDSEPGSAVVDLPRPEKGSDFSRSRSPPAFMTIRWTPSVALPPARSIADSAPDIVIQTDTDATSTEDGEASMPLKPAGRQDIRAILKGLGVVEVSNGSEHTDYYTAQCTADKKQQVEDILIALGIPLKRRSSTTELDLGSHKHSAKASSSRRSSHTSTHLLPGEHHYNRNAKCHKSAPTSPTHRREGRSHRREANRPGSTSPIAHRTLGISAPTSPPSDSGVNTPSSTLGSSVAGSRFAALPEVDE